MKNNLPHVDNVQNAEEFGFILVILLTITIKPNGLNLTSLSSMHILEDFSCEIRMLIPIVHTQELHTHQGPSSVLSDLKLNINQTFIEVGCYLDCKMRDVTYFVRWERF